jgi:cell division protease FtsH
MNPTVKTILTWVLILVAAVGLYSFVEQSSSPTVMLSLTDFINKVEAGQVAEVEINGSNLKGKYAAGGSIFRSTIPPEYPRIYDTLVAKRVIVRIIPPDTNPWSAILVSWGLPLVFVFGSQCLLTWCLYRAILGHLRGTPNGNAI